MVEEITIGYDGLKLSGHVANVPNARSWVIFAHGSGSSRKSPRNNWVASELNRRGHATLLFDLLTPEEDVNYETRFNLPLLSERLSLATTWLLQSPFYRGEPIVYFGASTGAGAALIAASKLSGNGPLLTVISRGGRPDLAGEGHLRKVVVPVLLIVGSLDYEVISLNEFAKAHLRAAELKLVEGATHLFEEPGKLGEVVELCVNWLETQLTTYHSQQPRNTQQGGDHVLT
jgi:putative phosphoribosyl transferase